jgi:hypothetical protein
VKRLEMLNWGMSDVESGDEGMEKERSVCACVCVWLQAKKVPPLCGASGVVRITCDIGRNQGRMICPEDRCTLAKYCGGIIPSPPRPSDKITLFAAL